LHPAVMPRPNKSSIQGANGSSRETSSKTPIGGGGTYADPSSVFRRKTAIVARVTGSPGQKRPAAQPAGMPRWKRSSIHGANGSSGGTSSKIPLAGGGT